jgi:hypothetical protein
MRSPTRCWRVKFLWSTCFRKYILHFRHCHIFDQKQKHPTEWPMHGLQYMEPESSRPFLWNHIPTTTTVESCFSNLTHRDHNEMDNPWFVRKHSLWHGSLWHGLWNDDPWSVVRCLPCELWERWYGCVKSVDTCVYSGIVLSLFIENSCHIRWKLDLAPTTCCALSQNYKSKWYFLAFRTGQVMCSYA